MLISLIVAAATNQAIGRNNELLWKLPNDMLFFKSTTWGMPVLMGRKTFDSMKGHALPGRHNIVITRQSNWQPGEGVIVVSSLEAALAAAAATGCREAFIIGGGDIYRQALSLAHRIYVTRVHASFEADTFFPTLDETAWQLVDNRDFSADEKHAYAYSFQVWERRFEL